MLMLVVLMTACGPHKAKVTKTIYASPDKLSYRAAALMPSCVCVTVAAPGTDPDPDRLNPKTGVWLRPYFKRQRLFPADDGKRFLAWGQPLTFAFDWAGTRDDDYYEIKLYKGRVLEEGDRPLSVEKYLRIVRVATVSCSQPPPGCLLSTLGMDSAQANKEAR